MLIVVVVINIWRRLLAHLPRKPDSVANIMSYVAGTEMCRDFEGLELVKVEERDKRIRELGKKYGYGLKEWANETKGGRWVVDEVPSEEPERGTRQESSTN
jgi:ketopantoate reductase